MAFLASILTFYFTFRVVGVTVLYKKEKTTITMGLALPT